MPNAHYVDSTTPASVGCRVFISYSHQDWDLAEAFHKAFITMAANTQQRLRLSEDRVFFDRAELKAGDDWDEHIQSWLESADLFVMLVSINSLGSKYCVGKELAIAARLGMPIVPVLLRNTPNWKERLVIGDAKGRSLGAFLGVPTLQGVEYSIESEAEANLHGALTQAVEQIADRLVGDDAAPEYNAISADPQKNRPAVAPLLTHLCNQQAQVTSFEEGLDAWPFHRSLLVLVKGEYADHASGFWDRLLAENLKGYCEEDDEHLPIGPGKVFELPLASDFGGDAATIASAVKHCLSKALFRSARRMKSGADLGALLIAEERVLPLMTTLPNQSPADAAIVMAGLLALFADIPSGPALRRLVVGVLIEGALLVDMPSLAEALGLEAYAEYTHVVETMRLQPLARDHVMSWYRANEVATLLPQYDEETLMAQVFTGTAGALRQRSFDQHVRQLLALGR